MGHNAQAAPGRESSPEDCLRASRPIARNDITAPIAIKRLRELERENAQLKRLVADKELENLALREISRGNW